MNGALYDTITLYLTDPNGHPLTWPVLGALLATLLVQLHKTNIIEWTAPAKWQAKIAYLTGFILTASPIILAGGGPLKALLSAAFAGFAPMGMYSIGLRPTLATPPASVNPPGASLDAKETLVGAPSPQLLKESSSTTEKP